MGYSFWRGVGYFFSIVTSLIGIGLLSSAEYVFHEILGLMMIFGGGFSMFMIRMIGCLDSIQDDLRYLANNEKKLAELESEKHLRNIDEKDKGEIK